MSSRDISGVLRSYRSDITSKYTVPNMTKSNYCGNSMMCNKKKKKCVNNYITYRSPQQIGAPTNPILCIKQLKCQSPGLCQSNKKSKCNPYTLTNCNGIEEYCSDFIECNDILYKHFIIGITKNQITIQIQMVSCELIENLRITNNSIIHDKKSSLISIDSNTSNITVINNHSVPDNFYLTGILNQSKLVPGVLSIVTYTIALQHPGIYKDIITINGNKMNPIDSTVESTVIFDNNIINDPICDKNGFNFNEFGSDMLITNGSKYTILIDHWVCKNNYGNVYVSFNYKLSGPYEIKQIYGITGSGDYTYLSIINTYDQETMGTVVSPIGREFDRRSNLDQNKLNYIVRCVGFIICKKKTKAIDQCQTIISSDCKCSCPININCKNNCRDSIKEDKYQISLELESILCKLKILKSMVINDITNNELHPTELANEAAILLCRDIVKCIYVEVLPDTDPILYMLVYDNTVYFKEYIYALDSNDEKWSICCLQFPNCNYIPDESGNITYLMALSQLENLFIKAFKKICSIN